MIDPVAITHAPEPASMSWMVHGVRLSTRVMPAARAARGGDWCEAFAVSPDVMALSIGDVCGHGDEKYSAMVGTRRALREAACRGLDPAQTLAEAHTFLRAFDPRESATALFGLLNLRTHTLVFANAGHPPPLMANPRETMYLEYPQSDLPLGIEDRFRVEVHAVDVPASTLLVLYTDGVTEHERKPVQGAAELRDAAMFAMKFSMLPTAAVIEQQMFLSGSNRDDAAILTAWTPVGPGPKRVLTKGFERPY
jgi:serine phosphatase RsbU (regulator of sigma subunit)